MDYSKLAGSNINSLVAYKPGKPISELKREFGLKRVIKLASNENPLGPSPKVINAITSTLPEISRYPTGDAYELRMAVAAKYNVSPKQLLFGAGSNEIIELLLRTYVKAGETTLSPAPSFSVYGIISQAMGSKCEWVPVRDDFSVDLERTLAAITPKTRVIFLANPNNPTGTYINAADLKTFIDRVPADVIVVMDEAYIEFADAADMPDTLAWLKNYPNMILMRTFSKAYGLAGLRVGYAIGDEACCDMMDRVRQPFNTNMLAQVAATVAIDDNEWLNKILTNNREGKNFLYQSFTDMGLNYVPTQANFMLVNVGDGERVFNELLKKGVIARFMGGSLSQYIRVSIGTMEENQIFIQSLREVL
ncbi:MAG: histidinol-phosphate transaminase [Deferribacteraceae bacterium]|jgi:histidinol-phosphate aminotransferase|nr:histidinol-phosphate transaminase [Deferribacteraceae bacterium]